MFNGCRNIFITLSNHDLQKKSFVVLPFPY